MQKLNSTVKLTGVLVSTTNQSMALKLGKKVNLNRLLKDNRARYHTEDDGHIVILSGFELYELA